MHLPRRWCLPIPLLVLIPLQALTQTFLGDFTSYSAAGNVVTVNAGAASVRFVFYRPEVVRVDFLPSDSTSLDSSLAVVQDSASGPIPSIVSDDSSISLSTASLTVLCSKRPVRLSFFDASHRMLLKEGDAGGMYADSTLRGAVFALSPDDHFYGTGERGTSLDKRGLAFDSYNTQLGGYITPLPTMNINIPFAASTRGYGLYFENTYPGRFDLGSSNSALFSYTAYGGELSYYMIAAPSIPAQLELYTWLTGRQPLPPRWAFGFIQSKFGYRNESEARAVVQTMRQKHIPCDGLVLDLYWFNQMGDISWNLSSWTDPFRMMRDFLATGIKTIVITEPYLTYSSIQYAEASALGYLAQTSREDTYVLSNWWSCGCPAALLDITNPAARTWWWSKHPQFFGAELAGIWTDLGEPERHPDDMVHFMGSAARVHNVYNLLWAKTIAEGFSSFRPNQRLFNLTRSGYAGIQRYGVIPWSGDVGKDFGGLAVQLPMMLNMGMSGLAYHNSDIGGFVGRLTTPELYVRWMQYGTFCPITRAHGTGQATEPWGFGPAAEAICKSYIELRYRLLPYIYTMAHENYLTGLPLARALFTAYPDDPTLLDVSSAYLWGENFLVAPVVQAGQTISTIALPPGKWIDYWTEAGYDGGQTITVPSPLEIMPLFVRAGSIIPMQPLMNYTDERALDTLTLAVYPSSGQTGHFTLYEDDGKTLAYQHGEFSETSLDQQIVDLGGNEILTLSIGQTNGTYTGRPARRVYLAEFHGIAAKPGAVRANGSPLPERISLEDLRGGGEGFFFDEASHGVYVDLPTVPDSAYRIDLEQVVLTGIANRAAFSGPASLAQNYPNPFNPTTTIEYTIGGVVALSGANLSGVEGQTYVRLAVYDMLGREVAVLVNEKKTPGRYEVRFDGLGLASGVYFFRLSAGSFTDTRKMLLLR